MPASERLCALEGHFIHLPLSTKETYKQLTTSSSNLFENIENFVLCYGNQRKDNSVLKHLVDRKKVYEALKWLCTNNELYAKVQVPELPDLIYQEPADENVHDDKENLDICQEKSWIKK